MSKWPSGACYPCIYFTEDMHCTKYTDPEDPEYESWCVLGPCKDETPSNADMIRAMDDDELAVFLGNLIDHDCEGEGCLLKKTGNCGWPELGCDESALQWLKKAVEA